MSFHWLNSVKRKKAFCFSQILPNSGVSFAVSKDSKQVFNPTLKNKAYEKDFAFLVMALLTIQFSVAGDVITMDSKDLPAAAQTFIKQYFGDKKISYIKVESELFSKTYEVVMTDRTKIEFDGKGSWEEVDCKRAALPQGLVPSYAKQMIETQYPGMTCTKIERDRGEVEVGLSNGLSLTFNKKGQLIDIDD